MELYDKNKNIIFDGDFNHDDMDGKGFLRFNNGNYYIGSVNENRNNDKKKLNQNNDILYNGEWKYDNNDRGGAKYLEDGMVLFADLEIKKIWLINNIQ